MRADRCDYCFPGFSRNLLSTRLGLSCQKINTLAYILDCFRNTEIYFFLLIFKQYTYFLLILNIFKLK